MLKRFLAPKHTRGRIWAARALAITADLVQIVLSPLFGWGGDDVIDVAVGIALVWLLGWHIVLLPAFVTEMIPYVGLVPTWTAAVLFVTRKGEQPDAPPAESSPQALPPPYEAKRSDGPL